MTSNEPAPDADADEEDGESSTHSTSKRWWLTNDLLAFVLTFGFLVLVYASGLGILELGRVPEVLLYVFGVAFGTAVAWAYGKEALEAWRGGGDR